MLCVCSRRCRPQHRFKVYKYTCMFYHTHWHFSLYKLQNKSWGCSSAVVCWPSMQAKFYSQYCKNKYINKNFKGRKTKIDDQVQINFYVWSTGFPNNTEHILLIILTQIKKYEKRQIQHLGPKRFFRNIIFFLHQYQSSLGPVQPCFSPPSTRILPKWTVMLGR